MHKVCKQIYSVSVVLKWGGNRGGEVLKTPLQDNNAQRLRNTTVKEHLLKKILLINYNHNTHCFSYYNNS